MDQVSVYLQFAFGVITLLTVFMFYKAAHYLKNVLVILSIWMLAQAFLALSLFYTNWFSTPPRFALLIMPPVAVIIILFLTPKGKIFLNQLDRKQLTLLHTVRIAVELILYYLFVARGIPQIMTFEGRNFDIIAGLTAPLVYYFTFIKPKLSANFYIGWNIICLALLANIVITAMLSAKSSFQQLAFDQPNIAIAYFPFNWLPSVVVPLVLLAHLASLKQAFKVKKDL